MPLLLDPLEEPQLGTGGTEPLLCDEAFRIEASQPKHEGCPVLIKQRAVIANKGVLANIRWPLRFPDGSPVNLLSCLAPDGSGDTSLSLSESVDGPRLAVRFMDCDCDQRIYEVAATSPNLEQGIVHYRLPVEIVDQAGIYRQEIGVVGADARLIYSEAGLVSVERGMWGDVTTVKQGPLTLGEIRMHLRDTPTENTLLDDVEFSVEEILHALVWPVQQWNELPPSVAPFRCSNFPFRFHWRQAVVGELLRTAGHHYMRNNIKVSHGGVSGNFKDRYNEYLQVSQLYRQEWLDFVKAKKVSINAGASIQSLGSGYGW